MNKVAWADKPQTKGFTDLECHKFYQCRSNVVRAIQCHDLKRKGQLAELSGMSNPEKYAVKSIEYTETEIDNMALKAFNDGGIWVLMDGKLILTTNPVMGSLPYGK